MARATRGRSEVVEGERDQTLDTSAADFVSLTDSASRRIAELIGNGTFAPGHRLPPERELAGTLGLSRGALREALRTLAYAGRAASLFADVGVAGLWRLTTRLEEIRAHPLVIVAAGMDAALPSVVGGLVKARLTGSTAGRSSSMG